jgi:hypothetical protein
VTGGAAPPWPPLPLAEWEATRDTLILWTQVVGKVRLAHTPIINHWWNVPLYVTARGFTSSLVPGGDGRGFEMSFDLLADQLEITVTDGQRRSIALAPRTVADFTADVLARLDELGLATEIWPVPVEIAGAVPFLADEQHATYDAEQARRFWRAMVQVDRVFHEFRARFVGKASPVHLFWGALDLAVTRFSGRPAPPHPGGAPNCGPHVMHEAYSHEVSSCGYWPGGADEGVFYSYAYPEPEGFRTTRIDVDGASFDEELGEFTLPYTAVRTAPDPDALLLRFLQSTYEAAADRARWDRAVLERPDES